MARYKAIDTNPRFLAVDRSRQFLPSTLEHALNELLDHDIDPSDFDARFRSDQTSATGCCGARFENTAPIIIKSATTKVSAMC